MPLSPLRRLALLALGYAIYVLAGPGVLLPEGSPLGALGLVFWALAASRPGPGRKRVEWLAGACAFTLQTTWMGIVFWFAIPWLFVGWGCWAVYVGGLVRRLGRRLPLSLATPIAWAGFEGLLVWVPPPLGLSWLRLGHYLSDWPALAGSGRVWGVAGLGYLLAALAGFLADLWVARQEGRRWPGRASWLGVGLPVVLAAGFALAVPPPATEAGPRLLLVQPAFEQARKQSAGTSNELFRDSFELTRRGLAELAAAGEAAPDLVCWGETMVPWAIAEPGLAGRIGELTVDPWHGLADVPLPERAAALRRLDGDEAMILRVLFDPEQGLEPSTRFLSGIVTYVGREGRLRRTNSVVLWDAQGARLGRVEKTHLAPGGETMVGLEAFGWVRDLIYEVANYVPDFAAGEPGGVLELPRAGGSPWRLGATVCFDNAYEDVYAAPLRAGPVDFHLVVSNEAWYEDAQELDQMIAFSRLHALCTARAFVRSTNSGVSAVFGPRGEELARLVVGGRDREVPGTLAVRVPVPSSGSAAERTPYVWLQPWLAPALALLPWLILAGAHRLGRRPSGKPEEQA